MNIRLRLQWSAVHCFTGSAGMAGCLLAAILLAGCNVDFAKMRREHATTYPGTLAAKTAAELPVGQAVGLDDCMRIALANNLDVQTSHINRKLAELDRKIAFSNFLPHVSVGVEYYETDKQQKNFSGGSAVATSDRAVTTSTLSVQQTIFAPETWFLYDAYVKGEGVSELVARRTRDLIRLQVTTLYFACLSQEQNHEALKSSLEQTHELQKEMQAMVREGLAMPAQLEQVRTLVLTQESNLADNERSQQQTRSALLEAMGLSPVGAITLKRETPLTVADQELPDQILQAMLNRPELHIADRTIEIRKDETRIAIAQFLPKISGFADFTHSSDSFLKYANLWTLGASGVLSVFDGFANIYEYKAAQERQKQAGVDREQKCLKIMLEVIQARLQYEQARDQRKVAQQDLTAAKATLDETQAKWREGLLVTSERLDAVTRYAVATANASAADFRVQVTTATLLDVIGASTEGSDREKEK